MFKASVSLTKRPRMAFRWRARSPVLWDGGLAAALTVAALAPQMQGDGFPVSELPLRHTGALAVALTVGQSLPLAVRRRPALCLTVAGGCFAAASGTLCLEWLARGISGRRKQRRSRLAVLWQQTLPVRQ